MTTVRIWKEKTGQYKAFEFYGHAKYARFGKDIVCAAISTLSFTAVSSIEKLCDDKMNVDADEKDGLLRVVFEEHTSKEATLIIDSMIIGLEQIHEQYGSKFIDIKFEEV